MAQTDARETARARRLARSRDVWRVWRGFSLSPMLSLRLSQFTHSSQNSVCELVAGDMVLDECEDESREW
jgi:hypothetical protein